MNLFIEDSHARCRLNGIKPESVYSTRILEGKEYYIEAYHKWTCSAAPIRDSKGNIAAVIDLTGYSENVHPHTLGMVIAATNKNLVDEVAKGNFRMDLFYRLNVIPIKLPALRERKEYIPILVNYYVGKTWKKLNKRSVHIPQEYMNYLQNYDWSGNIRELENVIELIVNTETIQLNLWNGDIEEKAADIKSDVHLSLDQIEKQHIISVLREFNGNITLSAKVLDIGRNTLYRKIEKHNINCSGFEHCTEMKHA